MDASFFGLGAALNQKQIVKGKLVNGPVCFISRQLKESEKKYGAPQMECLALVWALTRLHYYLDGIYFEVITDCQAIKSLLNTKTPTRHMLRWQMAIQEYMSSMTISHRPGNTHSNADALSTMALPNEPGNPVWEPKDCNQEIPIMGITMCDFSDGFRSRIEESYQQTLDKVRILRFLTQDEKDASLISSFDEEWEEELLKEKFSLISGLLYHREKHTLVILLPRKDEQEQIFQICHDDVTYGYLSLDKTIEKIATAA